LLLFIRHADLTATYSLAGFEPEVERDHAAAPEADATESDTLRQPPSLAGLTPASTVVRKPPPTLPSAAEAEELRRLKEARTEAEHEAVVAQSERKMLQRKTARRERLKSAGRDI
jgi:hypothetical protein